MEITSKGTKFLKNELNIATKAWKIPYISCQDQTEDEYCKVYNRIEGKIFEARMGNEETKLCLGRKPFTS
jgi:hypothetical protein